MKPVCMRLVLAGAFVCAGIATTPASGQTNEWGQTLLSGSARRNVNASLARAPGNMVNAGVARTSAAAAFAQSPIEIVEARSTDPEARQVFLSDAVEILFEQLNETLLIFENLLRARAGLPPRVPEVPDTGGGRGGGRR